MPKPIWPRPMKPTGRAPADKGLSFPGLVDLDQLDRLAARPLDHHRPCVTEAVGLLQEPDAPRAEPRGPGVEIAHAEPGVGGELPARSRSRRRGSAGRRRRGPRRSAPW